MTLQMKQYGQILEPQVIQTIHFPVSAKSFVMPMVAYLNSNNISAELWLECNRKHLNVIQDINVPKRLLNFDFTFNLIKFIVRLSRFRKSIRAAHPKVIHAHQSRASIIPLLAAYLEKVPIRIYHNHGLPYLGHKGPIKKLLFFLERINIFLANKVIMVSHSNMEAAKNDGLLNKKSATVLGNGSAVGIDLSAYKVELFEVKNKNILRKKMGINERAFVLAYVGRPQKRKGFHLLINAWEKSLLGEKGHLLIIAGCTDVECMKVIHKDVLGLRAFGYLNELKDFYSVCDAVVLPSFHEGFPYSLLEGAAACRPLIGSDIPGIRCAVINDYNGLLIPPNNEGALIDAISTLASNQKLRTLLGNNGRIRIEKEFDREIVLSDLLKYYESMELR